MKAWAMAYARALTAVIIFITADLAAQARISEWVEDAAESDNTKIALGYPVPIPVDTPQPFDGFRSYAGLHARHQDFINTTPWVHGSVLGTTRMGRDIWAYRLGDADLFTSYGTPEHAMLTTSGMHAREWQNPEVTTGIMELLIENQDDNHLYRYLLDNANVIVIPVVNPDGFIQTQRYPSTNWMGTDPGFPEGSPRDGRMRRKNMLSADEDLLTQDDHLNGVDLNRNNPPFWASNPDRSSPDLNSIVHHGAAPLSEPETRAVHDAVQLGPLSKLSMYTDLHSYSQVHAWSRTNNDRLTNSTLALMNTFTNHHVSFDEGKFYFFSDADNAPTNQGLGMVYEYFAFEHEVASFLLEVEPSGGSHPGLPGNGADYGGLSRNGHDGFILPDSEIRRVRTELAQSFAVAYYQQAGPPSLKALRIIDSVTQAVVFEAEWYYASASTRTQHSYQTQPVQMGRSYRLWVAFDKPMRWRTNGEVSVLPGQPESTTDVDAALLIDGSEVVVNVQNADWLNVPGEAPMGYLNYEEDSLFVDFSFSLEQANEDLIGEDATATFRIRTWDMTNLQTDADPSTVARWENGGWSGYEDSSGEDLTDTGGFDTTIQMQLSSSNLGAPFVVEPGTSSTWFDPSHKGEGFVLEILAGNRASMYWFTYDSEGNQNWYIAVGDIRGNRIVFPELIQVHGGEFGPGFDPDNVTQTIVGTAAFSWSDCDHGIMNWTLNNNAGSIRQDRQELQRLSRLMGIDCGNQMLPPMRPEALLSGSWYDLTHNGEGYTLEVLIDSRVLVYWFSFDMQGNRRWFFGIGEIVDGRLVFEEMVTTRGGIFGPDFDPATVEVLPWGSLEMNISCDDGTATFAPTEAGFPAGTLDLTRLTNLDGLGCGS